MKTIRVTVDIKDKVQQKELLIKEAIEKFFSTGASELSMGEAEIDDILGQASFCGGDLDEKYYLLLEEHCKCKEVEFFFEGAEAEFNANNFCIYVDDKLGMKSSKSYCEDKDWNEEWKKFYCPIEIDSNFRILPPWEKKNDSLKIEIVINPGQGFGTGSHATTKLCLIQFSKWAKNLEKHHKTKILDLGCGSGILGIGALKYLSKSHVDFCDIDLNALENCQQNISLNIDESDITHSIIHRSKMKIEEYDLVFANILLNVLIEEMECIFQMVSKNGSLIVSGILRNQVAELVDLYCKQGFNFVEELSLGEWSSIHFLR